jgi:hypothetical protein
VLGLAVAISWNVLSSPIFALALRAALGAYIVWMARGFYAHPLGYFRKWMPRMAEQAWMRPVIRLLAAFCVWGGCFIVATAVATQIFGLHGMALAVGLILLSAVAAYLLLPKATNPKSQRRDLGHPQM